MKQQSLHTDGDPQKKELTKKRHFSFRINLFFFITFLLFSILLVRLAILQFVDGKQLLAEKNKLQYRNTQIAPIRGNIYDKEGFPLAYTVSVQSVFFRMEAGAKQQDEIIELAYKLEEVFQKYGNEGSKKPTAEEIILLMDVGYDLNKNPTKDPGYSWIPRRIKADLSQKEIAYIMEHRDELKYLEVSEESIRTYTTEDENNTAIAAQLVGYMRPYSVGKESKSGLAKYKDPELEKEYVPEELVGFDGLELMYQDVLRGKSGSKKYPVNAIDRIIGKPEITKPEKGQNLYLTIQKDIQIATEKAIMDHLKFMRSPQSKGYYHNPNAYTGYAVAMEVKTGKVVAMASMPDYDTNVWIPSISTEDYYNILPVINNGTIRTAMPQLPPEEREKRMHSIVYMGSVIKPLTVLIGLNEKFFTPYDKYPDKGYFSYGMVGKQSTITNSGGVANGMINAADAIRVSSNTFMAEWVGQKLYKRDQMKGIQVLDSYFNKFGLGVLTGSGLPGEFEGISEYQTLAESEGSLSALVRASWGQNEKYTTLQLAQYAATLASKGKRMKPQFVEKITTYEGELVQGYEPEVLDVTEFPDEYWNVIFKGMKDVRKMGFDGVNYSVAVKTGTSTQELRGKHVDNAVFIAFAPIEDPTLAVAVVVPEGGFGSYGAAPIARHIFDAYDQYIGLDGVPKGAPERDQAVNAPLDSAVPDTSATNSQDRLPPASNQTNNQANNSTSNEADNQTNSGQTQQPPADESQSGPGSDEQSTSDPSRPPVNDSSPDSSPDPASDSTPDPDASREPVRSVQPDATPPPGRVEEEPDNTESVG